MKKIRILSLVIALLMLTMVFAACNNNNGDNETQKEKVTLTVWGSQEDQEMLKEMCAAFAAANPDKEYKFLFGVQGEGDAADKILNDVTSGPDVFSFASDQINKLYAGGALARVGGAIEANIKEINSATSVKVDDLENPWLWHCRCDDGLNVLILGKAVMEDYTAKHGSLEGLKVGIVCANDETGTSAAASYMEYFDKNGVEYYVDYHNKDDADLSAYVQKAIGEGVNAWVSSTHDIAAAALAQYGDQIDVIFCNNEAYLSPDGQSGQSELHEHSE